MRHHAAAGARGGRGARRRRLPQARRGSDRKLERRARGRRPSAARRRAPTRASPGALNPAFVFATLSGKLSQDDVVLNEAIRNGPILQEHLTAHQAEELCRAGRRRARLLRRHGAGVEAGAAGSPHRAGDRRRRLPLLLARQRLCGGAAIPDPDIDRGAGQWRLAGGEIRDAAGLSKGRCRRDRPVPVAADVGPPGRAAGFLRSRARRSARMANASPSPTNSLPPSTAALAALDDGKAAVLHIHVTRL